MNYDMKECGNRIRQLRIQHRYTQEEFAKTLNVDRSNLSRIESGKRGCSLELLLQISELFDATLDYLILGKTTTGVFPIDAREQLKEHIKELIGQLESFQSIL